MGPKSDHMAVVDNQLMIHGIDGIRIMDASAMPIIVSGNTHATIVMMAERGVEFIKKRWISTTSLDNRGGFETSNVISKPQHVNPDKIVFVPNYPYHYNNQHKPSFGSYFPKAYHSEFPSLFP